MKKVAAESYRVLKPGKKCAILIGDTRKHKHVVPIGFQIINIFLEAGFKLKELVIKRQHNCKTTGFWYEKSIKYNFLLLAHEYLPIFEKPEFSAPFSGREDSGGYSGSMVSIHEKPVLKKLNKFETTTVWIFPEKEFEERLNTNVIERYSGGREYSTIVLTTHSNNKTISYKNNGKKKLQLLFIKLPFLKSASSHWDIEHYLMETKGIVERNLQNINKGGFLVIQTQDVRMNEYIQPLAKRIIDILRFDNLWLKEIIVAIKEGTNLHIQHFEKELRIVHQYLLVYEVKK